MLFSSTMGFFSTGDVGLASARSSKPLEISSKVLPLVSGTLKNVKTKKMTRKTRKMRKTYGPHSFCREDKSRRF